MDNLSDKKKLIDMLNEALILEYTDFFSYRRESVLFREKLVEGEKLGKEFFDLSNSELRHADILSASIVELGSEPVWKIAEIFSSNSLRETLAHHMKLEMSMIKFYSEIIKINTDKNFEVILKGMQENEKEHLQRITEILSRLKG